jgi:hypothetical protein
MRQALKEIWPQCVGHQHELGQLRLEIEPAYARQADVEHQTSRQILPLGLM